MLGDPQPAGAPLDRAAPTWRAIPPLGRPSVAETGRHGLRLETEQGPLTIASVAPGIFRLRLGPPSGPDYGILVHDGAPRPVTITETEDGWSVAADGHSLSIGGEPMALTLRRGDTTLLASADDGHFVRPRRLPPLARTEAGWFAAFALDSDEAIYGLGEKWGPLDKRGQLIRSWNEDSLGVNDERSYKNCPFAWSPRGWGIFVHTPGEVVHAVGHPQWSQRSYALEVVDRALDLFLIAAQSPAEMLRRYTDLTGRAPLPPLWSLGIWLSRAYYRTAEELLAAAETVRERGFPCDVITLDGRAWLDTETRFAFEWDARRYPDPKAVTDRLHALDLRLCCWEYPLVSINHPLFAEMEAKGWLLTDRRTGDAYRYRWDLEPFGQVLTPLPESGLVDFTHPDAYAYWRDRHAELFAAGVDVIKSDFGEQVEDDVVAANGDGGRRLHNAHPLLYNRCVFEAHAMHGEAPALVLGRSGWAGSQRYPIQWGGDPQSDWEGLAGSLRGGLSWGLSGAPCYATDIGGFYGAQPSAELYVRWTQAAVFCSHMRFHGIGRREPWAFGDEAERIVRSFADLRYRLIPYIEGVLAEAAESGLPAMRAMALAFPGDRAAWAFDTQYLFGRDLLVAPILRAGGRVDLYLPAGGWFDFLTGKRIEGGRVLSITLPLDRFPVFAREGAAIALGPAVPSTAALADRERIDLLKLFGTPDEDPCQTVARMIVSQGGTGETRLDGVSESVRIECFGGLSVERLGSAVTIR